MDATNYRDFAGKFPKKKPAVAAADGPPRQTSFTYKLTDAQQADLGKVLQGGNYRPIQIEYTKIAAETDACKVALYNSGKCLVQGGGAEDFVRFVLEPLVLKEVRLGYEELLNPEAFAPHMGVDESGKGDFFGPLVIAGAYTDADLARKMKAMGVKDSKNITSDKRAMELADSIRRLLGRRFSIVTIGPEAYNRLYSKMKSVNTILAWGHARVIENLLDTVPDCPRAISDQFGSKSQVERALMRKGRAIELQQMHRAEADIAVAAASVLARGAFLQALRDMGEKLKISLRKGASDLVIEAGQKLVAAQGPGILLNTAKCHFRTLDKVLEKAGHKRSELGPMAQAVSQAGDREAFIQRRREAARRETEAGGNMGDDASTHGDMP
ncbi:MAG: ribonuclease HIII [Lentisphaerae bacterium]|nr:ribonuclease HIII [Lentisphaerota bacterium]